MVTQHLPHYLVKNAESAIEFYKKAFDAQEFYRFVGPDGKSIMHTELKIGGSRIMLRGEAPQMNCKSPQSLGGTGIKAGQEFFKHKQKK